MSNEFGSGGGETEQETVEWSGELLWWGEAVRKQIIHGDGDSQFNSPLELMEVRVLTPVGQMPRPGPFRPCRRERRARKTHKMLVRTSSKVLVLGG